MGCSKGVIQTNFIVLVLPPATTWCCLQDIREIHTACRWNTSGGKKIELRTTTTISNVNEKSMSGKSGGRIPYHRTKNSAVTGFVKAIGFISNSDGSVACSRFCTTCSPGWKEKL